MRRLLASATLAAVGATSNNAYSESDPAKMPQTAGDEREFVLDYSTGEPEWVLRTAHPRIPLSPRM
jgi:hypothetical protein